jgi:hypothetical protein
MGSADREPISVPVPSAGTFPEYTAPACPPGRGRFLEAIRRRELGHLVRIDGVQGHVSLAPVPQSRNRMMKDRKLTTIALAFAFSLSSTFALANTVRHKPNVRTYDLHRGIPLVRSRSLHPNHGNPDSPTSVSAGGYMWNGRSASEWGGG